MKYQSVRYTKKFISLIILFSFSLINSGLCQLYVSDCVRQQNSRCCCKTSESDLQTKLKIGKKCCCEIKESSSQTIAFESTFNELTQKTKINFSGPNEFCLNYFESVSKGTELQSSHSPQTKDICILNSIFRI